MIAADILSETDLAFREVGSLAELFHSPVTAEFPAKFVYSPKEFPAFPPIALGGPSQELVAQLIARADHAPTASLYYMKFCNAFVFPRRGFVFLADRAAFLDVSLFALCGSAVPGEQGIAAAPALLRGIPGISGQQDKILLDPSILERASRLSGCVMYPLHGGHGVYGHWWYDCMSSMYAAREALNRSGSCLLLDSQLRPWQTDSLALLGVAGQSAGDANSAVFCENLIVPSFISIANSRSVSGVTWRMFGDLTARFSALYGASPGHSKIYISRRSYPLARRMVNEAELEAALTQRGFQVLRPEQMTMNEQIAAFMTADVVVGAAGSGTVNAGFTRPGAALIDIVVEGNMPVSFFLRGRSFCLGKPGRYAAWCETGAAFDPELHARSPHLPRSVLYSYRVSVPGLLRFIEETEAAVQ